jgi:hypothetical protein
MFSDTKLKEDSQIIREEYLTSILESNKKNQQMSLMTST